MTQIIVVGGTKGGPGKSTVAQQIAACLKIKKKKKVQITDIDIQRTTTGWCEDRRHNEELELIPFAYVQDDIIKHITRFAAVSITSSLTLVVSTPKFSARLC